MKIVKSTKREGCKALISTKKDEKTESSFTQKITDFFGENKKRAIIIAASILMIGGAVLLNLKLFQDPQLDVGAPSTTAPAVTAENVDGVPETELEKTYFALAVIERQRARDEAIQVLQSVVDAADASEEDKTEALASISKIAEDIRNEANIETLLRAGGFENCIAIIENGKANIIVSTEDTLMVNQIAQITEIVYTQSGISPTNLVIKER